MDLISTYANGVSELTKFSRSAEKSPLIVDVIVNPHAGFFKRRTTLERQVLALEHKLEDLRSRSPGRRVEINTVHFTERPGHAHQIADAILAKEIRERRGIEHLIIGCGGDGTANEICRALVMAEDTLLERIKLLRLPLGTGNDVADAQTFDEAYDLILGDQRTVRSGAVAVTVADGTVYWAFNIASVGLDAYIAGLTNRFKRAIPGQAYKALVNIGTLFYGQVVHPQPMDIRLFDGRRETAVKGMVPSMVVVGASGHRTYGGHMPVLPGDDNVCIVDGMSIMRKISQKKLFYLGTHGELPEVRFHRADRVDIDYHSRIPLQLDGEIVWLEPNHFPLSLRVVQAKIKVLRR
ncbi:MAG: diacylglycerol kinase family protein [Spirochaetes bacterium]|nr:diacylglycerol kinase family protein [Spirochaetota bacterium]